MRALTTLTAPCRELESVTQSSLGSGKRKLGLVLSGGGLMGRVQVGCLEALVEAGITPDLVVGTSVGALNGAIFARQPNPAGVEQFKACWASLKPGKVMGGSRLALAARLLLGRDHLYSNKGLRLLLKQHAAGLTFEDLAIPLFVTATDLETGDLVVFHQGPLEPALLASSPIPGVFPRVFVDGKAYVDGGVLSHCNVETAHKAGALDVIVIDCPHLVQDRGYGPFRPLFSAAQGVLRRLCEQELEQFQNSVNLLHLKPPILRETLHQLDHLATASLIRETKHWAIDLLKTEGRWLLCWLHMTSTSWPGALWYLSLVIFVFAARVRATSGRACGTVIRCVIDTQNGTGI